jgi:PAS domain S-box-containing protein
MSSARVLLVEEDGLVRTVLDAIFAFVGLFSPDGVVLDVNEAPLVASTLRRDQVVGRRFVDLPWFAHAATERARISEAIAAAGRGERVRLETRIRSVRDGASLCIDAAFAPLRDANGVVTRVVGSGVDITDRKRTEEALAASESRLAEAQRVAHIGSWEWRVAEDRVRWSDELYRIYGLDESHHVPSYGGFLARVHPDDLEHTRAVIQQAVENVTPFVYDHRIRRPDGAVRMLHTRGEVIGDDRGRADRLVGSCWDVTDLWEASQALERTVSTLRSTLEATADGILVGDRQGRVAALNQRFLALWRLPSDIGPGADIRALADRVRDQLVDPAAFVARVAELYADAETEGFDVLRFVDGRVYERTSTPQRVGGVIRGRVCSFRDVTQRQRLLERTVEAQEELRASTVELRALAARLDAIREEERRLIAREIHDQIGQALTALKLDLGWLRGQLPADAPEATRARAAAAGALVEQTLETARRVSTALRPAILDDLGLAAALAWQAGEFQQRTGVSCVVNCPAGDAGVAPAIALSLFRIVQEALTNVARHAGARQVRVDLAVGADAVTLTVADDGRGVTAEEIGRPTSLGLVGMRERALVVGGEVTISGSPGRGTTLVVRVPTAAADAGPSR